MYDIFGMITIVASLATIVLSTIIMIITDRNKIDIMKTANEREKEKNRREENGSLQGIKCILIPTIPKMMNNAE